jgi:hypothetical protein
MKFAQVKKVQLICCGQGFNREYQGHYNRYKVLIDGKPIETLFNDVELKDLPYWVNRSKVMAMTCWGTSQSFEAQLALAKFLQASQSGKDWGEYTREIREKIEVIY